MTVARPASSFTIDDASCCAVLVVDMQHDFTHPNGALARMGLDISSSTAAVAALTSWLPSARHVGANVVFVRQEMARWYDDRARQARLSDERGWSRGVRPEVCTVDSWGAAIDAKLEVMPTDPVVRKHRYSAFYQTDMELVLRALGVSTVVVTGTALNACVDATARDAYMRGFRVWVPRELVGWSRPELADHAFRSLQLYVGEVCLSQEVLAAWRHGGSSR